MGRPGEQRLETERRLHPFHRHQLLGQLGPEQLLHSFHQQLAAGQVGDHLLVVGEAEMHPGVGQRQVGEDGLNMLKLGGRGAEELPPGRGVEEQLLHGDPGAAGETLAAHEFFLPSLQGNPGAARLGVGASDQLEAGDRGDGGQRLAPEAQGLNGGQPLLVADLAGGVALDGNSRIRLIHPRAVVQHGDVIASAVLQGQGDLGGPRIQRVFGQLLHHRGGPLHHLARRDLVDDLLGEHPDQPHFDLPAGGVVGPSLL